MYDPSTSRPSRRPAVSTLLVISVIGVLAAAGIAVAGCTGPLRGDTVPAPAPTAPESSSPAATPAAGTHTMIEDVCAPLRQASTSMSPKLSQFNIGSVTEDASSFSSGSCQGESAAPDARVLVDLRVFHDTDRSTAVEAAREDNLSGRRVLQRMEEFTEVGGIGDAASTAHARYVESCFLRVLDVNLTLNVFADAAADRAANLALAKQVAQAYLDATR
jgi:hypothetical protein